MFVCLIWTVVEALSKKSLREFPTKNYNGVAFHMDGTVRYMIICSCIFSNAFPVRVHRCVCTLTCGEIKYTASTHIMYSYYWGNLAVCNDLMPPKVMWC